MISAKLQFIMAGGSIVASFVLLNLILKYKLELKYSLLWFLLNIALILIAIYPKILSSISDAMGIELPVNALFFFGILLLMLIVFSLTVALSRMSHRLRMLSQELGLLKQELLDRDEKR